MNWKSVSAWPTLLLFFVIAGYAQPGSGFDANSVAPSIKVTARLVVLDVAVTDARGKPVDDLTAKDFVIYEDGQRQTIRSVEPPSVHSLPASTTAAGRSELFDPAEPANFGLSPVNVIVLDEANTHFEDSSFARREIRDFLMRQPLLLAQPTTLLSIYDNNFRQVQAFTRDRDALLRALANAPTEYAWKLEVNSSTEDGPIERLDQSLRALNSIAQDYARVPGRKNLIWVGAGFPTLDPTSIDGDDALEVKNALQHVTDVLLDTRVTLYAIDPTSSAVGQTEITDTTQLAFAAAAGDAMTAGTDPFNASSDFDRLGPVTGGRIVRGKNDVAAQIAEAVEMAANFYTLTYTPTSASDTPGNFRKIRVVCKRPSISVNSRTGYYATSPKMEQSSGTTSYDLAIAAESHLPLNGLQVTVEPNSASSPPANSYVVRVRATDLTWHANNDGSSTASVYILAGSLNSRHELAERTVQAMTASAKPGTDLRDPSHFADFTVLAPAHVKSPNLRFVVRDSASGRIGAADLKLSQPLKIPFGIQR